MCIRDSAYPSQMEGTDLSALVTPWCVYGRKSGDCCLQIGSSATTARRCGTQEEDTPPTARSTTISTKRLSRS
eukprot:2064837-Pyramimonas_sp.AAC.1